MNGFFSSAAVALNPLIGLVITAAGALIGAKLGGDAPLGILLGIVGGSAVAIGLCGTIAMLGQVVDAIEQPAAAQATAPATYAANTNVGTNMNVKANGAAGHATTAVSAKDDLDATQAAIRAAAAGLAHGDESAMLAGVEAGLQDLMKRGEFSNYHLAKAKRAFAEGNYKDADYQARASLAHNSRNTEARELRASARMLIRQGRPSSS